MVEAVDPGDPLRIALAGLELADHAQQPAQQVLVAAPYVHEGLGRSAPQRRLLGREPQGPALQVGEGVRHVARLVPAGDRDRRQIGFGGLSARGIEDLGHGGGQPVVDHRPRLTPQSPQRRGDRPAEPPGGRPSGEQGGQRTTGEPPAARLGLRSQVVGPPLDGLGHLVPERGIGAGGAEGGGGQQLGDVHAVPLGHRLVGHGDQTGHPGVGQQTIGGGAVVARALGPQLGVARFDVAGQLRHAGRLLRLADAAGPRTDVNEPLDEPRRGVGTPRRGRPPRSAGGSTRRPAAARDRRHPAPPARARRRAPS